VTATGTRPQATVRSILAEIVAPHHGGHDCHTCYHTLVQKTTVYLPDSLKRRLAQAAHRRGQPEAALIRAAIERLLDEEARPRPTVPLFRSGDPTLAERVDEALSGLGE
jgi:hypothetical protein